jgi:hypothetical protein
VITLESISTDTGCLEVFTTRMHFTMVEAIEALDPFQSVGRCDECGETRRVHYVDTDLQCANVCDNCDYHGVPTYQTGIAWDAADWGGEA